MSSRTKDANGSEPSISLARFSKMKRKMTSEIKMLQHIEQQQSERGEEDKSVVDLKKGDYKIECHENLLDTIKISNWHNHTQLLNATKYDFFNEVLSGLSRHRQGNKTTGISLVRMADVGLQIWRVLVTMGVREDCLKESLTMHTKNVDMNRFALRLMAVLQSFMSWSKFSSGYQPCFNPSCFEALAKANEKQSEAAPTKDVTCTSSSTQTGNEDSWPLQIEEEIIPPPQETDQEMYNDKALLCFDASAGCCVSCMATVNEEITKIHSEKQVIVENYQDLLLDKEKLYTKLQQALIENRDLQQKNNDLETRLRQLVDSNENTATIIMDDPIDIEYGFVPWEEGEFLFDAM
tara:strand:- start:2120 stop:3169 length:1050 start_codon:yes stop_codon:yes gene_type:complete